MNVAQGAGALVGVDGLYFLLAGEVSGAEALACLPVVVLSTVYAVAAIRTRSVPMRLGLRGAGALLKSAIMLLPETVRVGRALIRGEPAAGQTVHVPFRFGAFTAEDVGRRAAVVTAMSVAPNGIVLGMDRRSDALIVHRLVPQPAGGDREWPV